MLRQAFHGITRLLMPVIILFSLVFSGCENSIEVINNLTKTQNVPTLTRKNCEIFYSDSALIRIRIFAPKLERYDLAKDPYIDFTEGILVYFYDSAMNIQSEISADVARYFEKKQLWEAHDNVIAKNNKKGEQLNTEELFWDQSTQLIYSDKFSKVQTADGVFYGDGGFKANQTFSWWKLIGTKGSVNLKDE
jgi:LPS export ABC transporter protein LptC